MEEKKGWFFTQNSPFMTKTKPKNGQSSLNGDLGQ